MSDLGWKVNHDLWSLSIYIHVQWKGTTLQMCIFVAYQKLCKIVLFQDTDKGKNQAQ